MVTALVERNEGARLCSYPWIGLQDEVDDALEYKCLQTIDVTSGPPFHKMLAAWRIQRGNYRGGTSRPSTLALFCSPLANRTAAIILYEELQRLQTANVGLVDPDSRVVSDAYLALINVLSCVQEDQAWILSDTRADDGSGGPDRNIKRPKLADGARSAHQQRQVLTLADIRHQYHAEVERVGLLLNGGFFV